MWGAGPAGSAPASSQKVSFFGVLFGVPCHGSGYIFFDSSNSSRRRISSLRASKKRHAQRRTQTSPCYSTTHHIRDVWWMVDGNSNRALLVLVRHGDLWSCVLGVYCPDRHDCPSDNSVSPAAAFSLS